MYYVEHGPGQLSRYSDLLLAGRCGDQIPVRARISAPVPTGPEVSPASCKTGTGSFLEVKRPERCGDHVQNFFSPSSHFPDFQVYVLIIFFLHAQVKTSIICFCLQIIVQGLVTHRYFKKSYLADKPYFPSSVRQWPCQLISTNSSEREIKFFHLLFIAVYMCVSACACACARAPACVCECVSKELSRIYTFCLSLLHFIYIYVSAEIFCNMLNTVHKFINI